MSVPAGAFTQHRLADTEMLWQDTRLLVQVVLADTVVKAVAMASAWRMVVADSMMAGGARGEGRCIENETDEGRCVFYCLYTSDERRDDGRMM